MATESKQTASRADLFALLRADGLEAFLAQRQHVSQQVAPVSLAHRRLLSPRHARQLRQQPPSVVTALLRYTTDSIQFIVLAAHTQADNNRKDSDQN